jgi:tRNA-specific 2-thiouridylase
MTRIAAALSGGVDSTLAAWLLLRQGHQVVGLTLSLGRGEEPAPELGAAAARELGIAHQVVEAGREFNRQVVAPAVEAYCRGATPNPCAWCNARVKLPLLLAAARELGCGALATGHYARVAAGPAGPVLAEAADRAKSQAYFLARVRPELLARLVLPLGGLAKGRVRRLAARAGLSAAGRPESQDACFLPAGGWDELVERWGRPRPGPLEDPGGRELGRHQGLHRFTVGQRRGLGLAAGRPLYVLALDGRRAAVTVGPAEMLMARGLEAERPLWLEEPAPGERLAVRLRYAHAGAAARVEPDGRRVRVLFDQPQRAVAPGQLAVFSRDGRLKGSAWIKRSIP